MRPASNLRRPTFARLCVVLALALIVLGSACKATDDRPATWNYISGALFQPGCATESCHSRAAAVSGLDFSTPDRGYRSLTALTTLVPDPTATPGDDCPEIDGVVYCEQGRPLVTAFVPATSRVVNMLRARGAPRMPPDRPLPVADIELVEAWVLDGARETPGGPPAGTGDAGTD
jgi:hypothetical protein